MNQNEEEEKFLSNWYDWEVHIDENSNFFEEIEPEEIVAINKGFGLTKGISTLAGSLNWDKNKKRFIFSKIKLEKSRKINFYEYTADKKNKIGLFKVTDLSSPTKQSHKILMSISESKKIYSIIEKHKNFKLNDSYKPITQFNEHIKLNISNMKMLENYIIFYFLNVKGRHGRFYPLTKKIDTLKNEINNFLRFSMDLNETIDHYSKIISKNLMNNKETKLSEINFNISFQNEKIQDINKGEFYVLFKDSIFSTEIQVEKNGNISLANEKQIFEIIPK